MKNIQSRVLLIAVLATLVLGALLAWSNFFSKPQQAIPEIRLGDGINGPKGMAWIPGGEFLMGSDHKKAQANEKPTHKVRVAGFWMDTTHVTNDQFAQFVKETNYKATAEQVPDWETIRVQLPPGTPKPPSGGFVL